MAKTTTRGSGGAAGKAGDAAGKKQSRTGTGSATKKKKSATKKRAPSAGKTTRADGAKAAGKRRRTKATNKTTKTAAPVTDYIAAIADDERREDCETLAAMMEKIVGEPPRMWGSSLVGFGQYHYVYDSGREGDFFLTGFSSRARNLTLYIMPGFGEYDALMERLGPHTTGKSCLYVKRLSDLHLPTLRKLITASVRHMRRKYPAA